MIFKRLNRTEPERVFIVMQANEANIAADDVVALELTAASVDGIKVAQPVTAALGVVRGVADAAIANGAYGLVQVHGYRSTSRVVTTDTSIAAGAALVGVNAQDYWSTAASNGAAAFIKAFILESHTTSTGTVSKKIFIEAL